MPPSHNGFECDVVIVGGGVVGLTLALSLAQAECSVLVLDSQPPSTHWSPEHWDIRTSAITRATQNIWTDLGVWPRMVAKRVAAYDRVHIEDAEGFGEITFSAAESAEPNLGHIVENRVLLSSLWEQVLASPNIQIRAPLSPQSMQVLPEAVHLELSDASLIKTQLVVGADGSRSWVRTQANIAVKTEPYQQAAVVITVRTEEPHGFTAWQRFFPEGPLAFLPLADEHLCSIVWTQPIAGVAAWCAETPEAQSADLTHASEGTFGRVEVLSPPQFFPLVRSNAEEYVKPRVALVGDAAHVIHPLAGQGVNLGVAGAATLAQAVAGARGGCSQDRGHYWTLRRYERAHRSEVAKMQGMVGGVHWIFRQPSDAVRGFRSMAMQQIDKVKPLKRWLVKQALGAQGAGL